MSGPPCPRIAERETNITELLQQQSKARGVVLTKHVRPLRRVERRHHREVSRRECRCTRQIPEPVACLGSTEVVALALDYQRDLSRPTVLRRHELRVAVDAIVKARSEEHTSELQSLRHLVCRL